jgi:putative transposase
MSNLRRYDSFGKPYFITCVTYNRQLFLLNYEETLTKSFERSRDRFDRELIAWVILPEHFHLLVNLPNGEISPLMHWIKQSFSMNFRKIVGNNIGRIWQYRYWDHIIRDEKDLRRHINYIHYNPVKHEMVNRSIDYRYSTIDKYRECYSVDWGIDAVFGKGNDFGE